MAIQILQLTVEEVLSTSLSTQALRGSTLIPLSRGVVISSLPYLVFVDEAAALKFIRRVLLLVVLAMFCIPAHAQKPIVSNIEDTPRAELDTLVTFSNCVEWSDRLPMDPTLAPFDTLYMEHMGYLLTGCADRFWRRGLTDQQTIGIYVNTILVDQAWIRALNAAFVSTLQRCPPEDSKAPLTGKAAH